MKNKMKKRKQLILFLSCLVLVVVMSLGKTLASQDSTLTPPTITASDGITSGNWHKKAFTLTFGGYNSYSGIKYYYGTYGGNFYEASSLTISSNTNTVYYVKACDSQGTCSDVSKYIAKLDKSTPVAPTITANDGITSGNWHGKSFKLILSGSSSTSGITYYYGIDGAPSTQGINYTVNNLSREYTFIAIACNGAGTCSSSSLYDIKIDQAIPKAPTMIASDGLLSGETHNKDINITLGGSDAISGITYYYQYKGSNAWIAGNILSVTSSSNYGNWTYTAKACNGAGVCSEESEYIVKIDKTMPAPPTIIASDGIASGQWHDKAFTLTFKSNLPYGETYYYSINGGAEKAGSSLKITDNTSSKTVSVKVCSGTGKCSSKSTYEVKLKIKPQESTTNPESTPKPTETTKPTTTQKPSDGNSNNNNNNSNNGNNNSSNNNNNSGNTTTRKSDNNNLSSLEIEGYALEEVFSPTTLNYTVIVPNAVSSIVVNAVSEHNKATITGNGNQVIPEVDKTLKVVVTSESGKTKEYIITVVQKEIETKLKSLKVENFVLNETFSPEKTAYTLTVPYETKEIKVGAIAENAENQVIIQGSSYLSVGKNTVAIIVKSKEGKYTRYTIMVTRKDEEKQEIIPSEDNNDKDNKINYIPWIIGGIGIAGLISAVFIIRIKKKKERIRNLQQLNDAAMNQMYQSDNFNNMNK